MKKFTFLFMAMLLLFGAIFAQNAPLSKEGVYKTAAEYALEKGAPPTAPVATPAPAPEGYDIPINAVSIEGNTDGGGTRAVNCVDKTVTNSSTTPYGPIYFNWNNTYTQIIYTAAEIGYAGQNKVIKSVGYKWVYSSSQTVPITIYMANTTNNTFTSYIPLSSLTQVYSGTQTFTNNGGWITIELTTEFNYTGGNLVVAVLSNRCLSPNNCYFYADTWQGASISGTQYIYWYSDVSSIDPANPGSYGNQPYRPSTKFEVCDAGGSGGQQSCGETIFTYTGSVQTMEMLPGRTYTIEAWGGNGGGGGAADAIKGGYSKGDYTVTSPTTVYIYVGGKGNYLTTNAGVPGGWNGGGSSTAFASGTPYGSGSGGGGTDVRTSNNTTYADRIIVAGGGGGGGGNNNGSGGTYGQAQDRGGYGGGNNGGNALSTSYPAGGGTQTAGGAGAYASGPGQQPAGAFGIGGSATGNQTGGGGGGGWYGGGAGAWEGAGAGSGYIGGVQNGITARFDESGYVPNPNSTGNGYVKITCMESECEPATNLQVTYNGGCAAELTWSSGEVSPLVPGSITTQAAGNGYGAVAFDVVAGAKDITITSFSTYFYDAGPATVYVYYRVGTACGNAGTTSGWVLVGQTNITVPPPGNTYTLVSDIPMPGDLTIPAGQTYGIYIGTFAGSGGGRVCYYNGGSTCGVLTVVNDDLTIKGGHGITSPTGLGTGSIFTERCFAGTLNYTTQDVGGGSGGGGEYIILRDGEVIADHVFLPTNYYLDMGPFDVLEGHTWEVIAICDGEETEGTTAEADACDYVGNCDPPTDLTGAYNMMCEVPLSWTPPANVGEPALICDDKICGTNQSTNSTYCPVYNYYYHSYGQYIYDAAELGGIAGTINSISLYYNYSEGNSRPLTLYLGNTTKSTFASNSATEFVPLSALTTVYTGTWSIPAGTNGWVTITFNTPFNYTGGNLVVAMLSNTTAYQSGYRFYNTVQTAHKTLQAYHDSGNDIDPANPVITYPDGSYTWPFNRPNIRFTVCSTIGGFNIYRDNELIVSNYEETEYFDSGFDPMTSHGWAVRAICEDGTESSGAFLTLLPCANCEGPTNLEVEYTDDCMAILTWEEPDGKAMQNKPVVVLTTQEPGPAVIQRGEQNGTSSHLAFSERSGNTIQEGGETGTSSNDWIKWTNGVYDFGVGLLYVAHMQVACRFLPSDLAALGVVTGDILTKTKFYPYDVSGVIFELRIYQGGTAVTNPGTLMYSQPLTGLIAGQYNETTLNTPYIIDASQELWIVYSFIHTPGQYPAGADTGPGKMNQGDIFSVGEDDWMTLYDDTGGWYSINWMIEGYV
jgi:hypothetical protein